MIDFTLPELGENITVGDVLRILVKPGDTLAKDQPVLELETDKATIEVPSSVAGRVTDLKVKEGDKVKVGQAILSVEDGAPAEKPAVSAGPAKPAAPVKAAEVSQPTRPAKRAETGPAATAPAEARPAPGGVAATSGENVPDEPELEQHVEGVLREPVTDRAGVRKQAIEETEPIEATAPGMRATQADSRKVVDITRGARAAAEPAAAETPSAPAAPSVRRMARELGVNVDQVAGSGADGR
ncbi:MAG: pyruvate dehydrogenase, partial [Acidobacteria bacterium]